MNFNGPLKNPHDTITIQSTKKGVNPLELTPCLILVELRGIEPLRGLKLYNRIRPIKTCWFLFFLVERFIFNFNF